MNYQPIIDVRRSLPWRRRITSEFATFAVWVAWIVLCLSTFASSAHAASAGRGIHTSGAHTAAPPVGQIEAGLTLAALGLSALWAVPRLRRTAPRILSATPDYASHFGLPETLVETGRTSQVCIVHHDNAGRILAIETPAAQRQPEVV